AAPLAVVGGQQRVRRPLRRDHELGARQPRRRSLPQLDHARRARAAAPARELPLPSSAPEPRVLRVSARARAPPGHERHLARGHARTRLRSPRQRDRIRAANRRGARAPEPADRGAVMDGHPLAVFLEFLVGGWLYYLLLAGTSYLVLFVWQRARFHPGHV